MLFLLKKSKEFFDYDFGYSQTKKDFFSKKKIVIYFLHIFRKKTYKVLPPPPHPARSASLFDKRIVLKLKGASINNFIDAFFVFKSLRISRLIWLLDVDALRTGCSTLSQKLA